MENMMFFDLNNTTTRYDVEAHGALRVVAHVSIAAPDTTTTTKPKTKR
jgi:hypothetical protein